MANIWGALTDFEIFWGTHCTQNGKNIAPIQKAAVGFFLGPLSGPLLTFLRFHKYFLGFTQAPVFHIVPDKGFVRPKVDPDLTGIRSGLR